MGKYFDENQSIYEKQADNIEQIVKTIAHRYMGQNPPHPVTYRAYCKKGIHRVNDYRLF